MLCSLHCSGLTLLPHGPCRAVCLVLIPLPLSNLSGSSPPDALRPLDISCRSVHDVSPSQGTAVLPLHPIARPPEAVR